MGNCLLPKEINEIEDGTTSLPMLLMMRMSMGSHMNGEGHGSNVSSEFGFGDTASFGDFGGNSGFGGFGDNGFGFGGS